MKKCLKWFAAAMIALPGFAFAADETDPSLFLTPDAQDLVPKPVKPELPPNPLNAVGEKMESVVGDLKQFKTGKPVQEKQQEIVSILNLMIEELEKQCNSCSSCNGAGCGACDGMGKGNTNRPGRPAGDSNRISGPDGGGDLKAAANGSKKWADLRPKDREKVLSSEKEGFPPGFESILGKFYKRLAEEEVVAPETP